MALPSWSHATQIFMRQLYLITSVCFRRLKSHQAVVLINLCVALIISNLLFVTGVDKTSIRASTLINESIYFKCPMLICWYDTALCLCSTKLCSLVVNPSHCITPGQNTGLQKLG